MKSIDNLIEAYLKIIDPVVLTSKLSKDEFRRWVEIGEGEDKDEYKTSLQLALKSFETAEIFEYCQIIKEKLDSLVDN